MTYNEAALVEYASHTETCRTYAYEQACENGADWRNNDDEAVEWAALYLKEGTADCICNY